MTTFREESRICVLCGKSSTQTILTSTNTFGPSDLDSRPPEMARSTINMWIQRCPSCYYCAPDISEAPEKAGETVKSSEYRKQFRNSSYPKLANRFLCYALVAEAASDYINAGWASLHAAWVCDDSSNIDGIKGCRQKAATLFLTGKENKQRFMKSKGEEELLIVDLLRRCGEFQRALTFCDAGLKRKPGGLIEDCLNFEKELIDRIDSECHSIRFSEETK